MQPDGGRKPVKMQSARLNKKTYRSLLELSYDTKYLKRGRYALLNHIRIMLQIKDKNITFLDVTEEEIKGQLTNVVHATLSPEMRSCPE